MTRFVKNVPWIVALASLLVAVGRDVTCNAYASSRRVDAIEQRLDAFGAKLDRIIERLEEKCR